MTHVTETRRTDCADMKIRMIVILLLAAGTAMAQGNREGRQKPPSPAEFIENLDKDGDGQVSKEEFDGPEEHFTTFDKNSDGYISEDEVPSGPPPRGSR